MPIRKLPLFLLLATTAAAQIVAPATAPATLPALNLSSPYASYLTYQKLILAGDLDALDKCSVEAPSADIRLWRRAANLDQSLACAAIARFGTKDAGVYLRYYQNVQDTIDRAVNSAEILGGPGGQLLLKSNAPARVGATPTPIDFVIVSSEYRMSSSATRELNDQDRTYYKARCAAADQIIADMNSGKIRSMADFDKAMNQRRSLISKSRWIAPVFEPPALDPAGLRVSVEAVPADKSEDHKFHVDIILRNAGDHDLNILLGSDFRNHTLLVPGPTYLEALDTQGNPHLIPLKGGLAYSGPPPVPWIATLHPGDSYSLRSDMSFGGPPLPRPTPPANARGRNPNAVTPLPPVFLPPGTYDFSAIFIAGPLHETREPGDIFMGPLDPRLADLAKKTFWTGTILSPAARIEVPAPAKP